MRTKGPKALAVFALLLFAFLSAGANPAQAATFTVTNTDDAGPGSLRQAITDANDAPGDDTINITATGTINLQSALPRLFTNVQVLGPGADKLTVRRDTGGYYAILAIQDSDVTVKGLTVADGEGGCCDVAGIAVSDSAANHLVTLSGVVVTANEATVGGGISNGGVLALTGSTVSGNTARHGGGIRNDGSLTLTNSTVSGNTATGDQPSPGMGGGILNYGTLTITNSTLSHNTASYGANLYTGLSTTSTLANTIMANPQLVPAPHGPGFGCFTGGTVISQGHNLDEDGSCVGPGAGDIIGQDPKLGPLQGNGGPTPTHALLGGSPAIDTGATCPAADQRGKKRDDGDGDGTRICDIGAFERQVAPRVTRVTPANGATGISPRANVTAVFSEAMNANTVRNPTSLRSKTFTLRKAGTTARLGAEVTYYPATRKAVFNPVRDLSPGATYIATVTTGARDLAGNALDQAPGVSGNQNKTWKFKVR